MHTIIYRHRKENLRKCTLTGLEDRADFSFYTYPNDPLPNLPNLLLLGLDYPPLSYTDRCSGILILDGKWEYAAKMLKQIKTLPGIKRSIPSHFRTAYARRQDDCPNPELGLASIEAIYIAYRILGWNSDGLLDHYYWKDLFLEKNTF